VVVATSGEPAGREPSGPTAAPERLVRLLTWSLLVGLCLAAALGFGLGHAGEHLLWSTWFVAAPGTSASLLLGVAAFVGLAACGEGRRRGLWRLAASACLAFVWVSYRVLSMGDGKDWRGAAEAGWLGASEPLSSLVLAGVAHTAGMLAIEWLPPVFGLVASCAWLWATDRWVATDRAHGRLAGRLVAALVWVSSGLFATFFHGFVENTQLGVSCLILGLAQVSASVAPTVERRADPRLGPLLFGSAWLALAAATHLQYAGMAAVALAAAVGGIAPRGWWQVARGVAAVALGSGTIVAAALASVRVAPFQMSRSNIAGGPDGRLLVPFCDAAGQWFGPGLLLSADHLSLVVRALCFASPVFVVVAVVAVATRGALVRACAQRPVLVFAGVAYVGFVSLYGFDLGWPGDLDLMVTMSASLSLLWTVGLLAVLPAMARWGRVAVLAGLAAAAWLTLAQVEPIVYHRSLTLAQANSPSASLSVVGANPAGGPIRIVARSGVEVRLSARGRAGAAVVIGKGVQQPAVGGDPYGRGVIDVLVPRIDADSVIHTGVFDAEGEASCLWTVTPLADGRHPGVQMFVAPGADTAPCLSAALYFVLE
jgi:hypothetical protein